MKSTLTISDVLQLTEVVSQSVEFEMNIKTYFKLMGLENVTTNKIPQIQNKINGVRIYINNSLNPNHIKMNSKFKSSSKKSVQIIVE
ncbi:hypothetical protein [Flavobacterium sp. I3-2]|uniref:hypothetical protein n=1 Tax=Flavobacterium sp. I3-2 TaxID=2748319 RepID=UPI0015AB3D47|nr:hypothetical protein [Flavobacterium sp. I3-2]